MSEADYVQVSIRIRPFIPRDAAVHARPCVSAKDQKLTIGTDELGQKTFQFDSVWHPQSKETSITSDQKNFFDSVISPMMSHFEEGYDCTVFTYGHSNTGNTHTCFGTFPHIGLVPLFADAMYDRVGNFERDKKTRLGFSLVEVFNDQVLDLMSVEPPRAILKLRLQKTGYALDGLTEIAVINIQDFAEKLAVGLQRRSIGTTASNPASSRGHTLAIFTLYTSVTEEGRNYERIAKFSFYDVAGRQRAETSGLKGDRLKEASKINLSHSALFKVVDILSNSKKSSRKGSDSAQLIPYRETILTQLLKEALGGRSKTHMIGCISPCDVDIEDTLVTLRLADKMKRVINLPVQNEFHLDATHDPSQFERDWDSLKYSRQDDSADGLSHWSKLNITVPSPKSARKSSRRFTTTGESNTFRDDISEVSWTDSIRSGRFSVRGMTRPESEQQRLRSGSSKIPTPSPNYKGKKDAQGLSLRIGDSLHTPKKGPLVFSPSKRNSPTNAGATANATEYLYPNEASLVHHSQLHSEIETQTELFDEHDYNRDFDFSGGVGTDVAPSPSSKSNASRGVDFEVQTESDDYFQPKAMSRAWSLPMKFSPSADGLDSLATEDENQETDDAPLPSSIAAEAAVAQSQKPALDEKSENSAYQGATNTELSSSTLATTSQYNAATSVTYVNRAQPYYPVGYPNVYVQPHLPHGAFYAQPVPVQTHVPTPQPRFVQPTALRRSVDLSNYPVTQTAYPVPGIPIVQSSQMNAAQYPPGAFLPQ